MFENTCNRMPQRSSGGLAWIWSWKMLFLIINGFLRKKAVVWKTKTFSAITTYVGKNQGEKFAKEFFEKCLKIVPPTNSDKKVFPVTEKSCPGGKTVQFPPQFGPKSEGNLLAGNVNWCHSQPIEINCLNLFDQKQTSKQENWHFQKMLKIN